MFEQVARMQGNHDITAFGVTVGKRPTSALAYVDDTSAVLDLLNTLVKVNERDKGYFSTYDLPAQAFGHAGVYVDNPQDRLVAVNTIKNVIFCLI